jgi:hypothetical protein
VCLLPGPARAQDIPPGTNLTITLKDGEKVIGTLTKREAGKVYLKADKLGDVVIDETEIASAVPTGPAAPPAAAPAQATAPAVKWTTNATFGYTFVSGAAPLLGVGDTHGVSISGFTERAGPKNAVAIIGAYTYQRTKPIAAAANNGSLTLAYNQPLSPRFTFLSRTTVATDDVQKINSRIFNVDGIGFLPLATKKVKLSIAPGLGFTDTNRDKTGQLAAIFANVKDSAFGYGVYENLIVTFLPTLMLNQNILHLHSFKNTDQYLTTQQISLVGMVSPKVGLSITFNSTYDSQMPEPYFKKWTNQLVSGIQLKF